MWFFKMQFSVFSTSGSTYLTPQSTLKLISYYGSRQRQPYNLYPLFVRTSFQRLSASCNPFNKQDLGAHPNHEYRLDIFHNNDSARKLAASAFSSFDESRRGDTQDDSRTEVSASLQCQVPQASRHFPVFPTEDEVDEFGSYAVPNSNPYDQAYMEFTVDSVQAASRRCSSRILFDKDHTDQHNRNSRSASKEVRRRLPHSQNQLFEAIPDDELGKLKPDKLTAQQLLYALGRGCMLSDSKRRGKMGRRARKGQNHNTGEIAPTSGTPLAPRQWQLMFLNLQKRISDLTPIELSRACQTLAYVYLGILKQSGVATKAPGRDEWLATMEECNLTFSYLQRHIAMHANEFQGDCLSRIFYATIKGGFSDANGFVEFLCTEGRL